MKQHAVWLVLMLGLFGSAGLASAQDNGLYLGLGAGATIPLDSDIDGTGISTSADFDTGWMGIGALGYRFPNGIRTEFELGYRSSDIDSLSGISGGTGDVHVGSVMGNVVYTFRNESAIAPYLGLGVGYASVDFDSVQPVGGSVLNDSDGVFAYQGIAGLGYRLSERIQLFTDYRYFATADANLSTRANVSVDGEYADHSLLVGLRFLFAAPKPAMKAEPVKQPAAVPEPVAPMPAAPVPAVPKVTASPPPPIVELPRTYLVFFDWDKADLKAEALAIVKEVAVNVDRIPVLRIEATGHADRSGPDRYNLDLSRRRAEAVRAELIRLGVSPAEIVILWKGEQEPLIETGDGVREPQNRRVVINIQ